MERSLERWRSTTELGGSLGKKGKSPNTLELKDLVKRISLPVEIRKLLGQSRNWI